MLSMDEAKSMPAVSEQFKAIDTNGDGKISMAEFTTAMKR
jgi:Ca2+-binding EF-hand superfamily protein